MNKKNLQILFTITLVLFLGVGVYKYRHQPTQFGQNKDDGHWKTFNKVSLKKIQSYPTTHEEKKDMKVDTPHPQGDKANTDSQRAIASSPQKLPGIKDRPWKGVGPRPRSSEIDNEYNPQWKDQLGSNLLRFLRPKTKTIVKRESSALIKHKGKNLMVEHVVVKLKTPEGRHYGYNAYVDSSNGKVLHTWNRTIHEQFGRKHLRLSPSLKK